MDNGKSVERRKKKGSRNSLATCLKDEYFAHIASHTHDRHMYALNFNTVFGKHRKQGHTFYNITKSLFCLLYSKITVFCCCWCCSHLQCVPWKINRCGRACFFLSSSIQIPLMFLFYFMFIFMGWNDTSMVMLWLRVCFGENLYCHNVDYHQECHSLCDFLSSIVIFKCNIHGLILILICTPHRHDTYIK